MLARVKDTSLNRRVLNIYNDSRPAALDHSHFPEPLSANDQRGLLVRALGAARDYLFGAESIDGIALQYLDDDTSIPELLDGHHSIYKTIYSLLLEYQKQKKSRGFAGANFNENTMIDHRYLIVGLLGRKIIALVKASDEQRELHQGHLMRFLRALFEKDARELLLATQSDDSRYLSLTSVLLNIQILLKGNIDQIYFESEEQKIKDDLFELSSDVREVMADFNEVMLRFAVPCQESEIPANAITDMRLIPMLRDNERYRKIVPTRGYEAFVTNQFDAPARVLDGDKLELQCSSDFIMRSTGKTLKKIVNQNNHPILANDDLMAMFATVFACRNQFITNAMDLISRNDQFSDMNELYKQLVLLQEQFSALVKQFALFAKEMGKVFAETRRREYEHAKYAYLRVDWQKMHADFSRILGLMNRITCSAQLCATRAPVNPHDSTQPGKAESVLISSALQNAELEQSFVQLLDTRAYAIARVESLEKSFELLEETSASVRKDKTNLEREKRDHEKKVKALERERAQLQAEIDQLRLRSQEDKPKTILNDISPFIEDKRAADALRSFFGTLDFFVGKYKERANCGFWHRHGTHGKQVATAVLRGWQAIREREVAAFERALLDLHVRCDELTQHEYVNKRIGLLNQSIERMIQHLLAIMRDERLDGNYNKHSLKTYLFGCLGALQHSKITADNQMLFCLTYSSHDSGKKAKQALFTRYYVAAFEKNADITSQIIRKQYEQASSRMILAQKAEPVTPANLLQYRS